MAKIPASTRLEPDLMNRLAIVAKIDRRSISELIEICVEEHFPILEREYEVKTKAVERIKPREGKRGEKVA